MGIPQILSAIVAAAMNLFSGPKKVIEAKERQQEAIISNPKKYNQAANLNLMTGFSKSVLLFCIFVVFGQWVSAIIYMPFAHRIAEAWVIIPDWQEEAIKAYCLGILSVRPLNMMTGAIADGISLFRK